MLLQVGKEKYWVIIWTLGVIFHCNKNGRNILPQTDPEATFTVFPMYLFTLLFSNSIWYLIIYQSVNDSIHKWKNKKNKRSLRFIWVNQVSLSLSLNIKFNKSRLIKSIVWGKPAPLIAKSSESKYSHSFLYLCYLHAI